MKISVIVPVRATQPHDIKWLEAAIDSVRQQEYKDWELIMVNDHSTESLRPVAKMFREPNITGLKAIDMGVAHARNLAVEEAEGPLLLPLDHDDKLPPSSMVNLLEGWEDGGSKQGIVYGHCLLFGPDIQKVYQSPKYDFRMLLRTLLMPVGSLHRKADWKKVGGWNPMMEHGLEDWEYWIAMGEAGVCGHNIGKITYHYRRHTESRLARLHTTPDAFSAQYQVLRQLHMDTFNGKFTRGCCGQGAVAPSVGMSFAQQRMAQSPQNTKAVPVEAVRSNGLVQVKYIGRMKGGFGLMGKASGFRYNVPGAGMLVELPDGRRGVDPRDLNHFLKINRGRDFLVQA